MSHYRPYPEYEHSIVPWLGQVPQNWLVKPLWSIASVNDDDRTLELRDEDELSYVDISAVAFETGIGDLQTMLAKDAPSRAQRRAKAGDIVLSTVRTYLRAIGRVLVEHELAVFSTGFAVLRAGEGVTPDFLYLSLLSDVFHADVESQSAGISYPAINPSDLLKIKIPVPSRAEQDQISRHMSRELVRMNELIAKKSRFIGLLREKRQSLIAHAVTRGLDAAAPTQDSGVAWLGRVPAHWEIRRIAILFREAVRPGRVDLPVLSISIHTGITDEELSNEDRDRKVALMEDREQYKRVQPGDLAYNMMRAWQGAFGMVSVDGLVSPAYVVAEPKAPMVGDYFELLLRTPMAIEEMRRYSRGIADFRMRLYWESFRDIAVSAPPIDEQRRIVEHIKRESELIDALINKTERSIDLLKERRRAFITAAVTGQIDLRDAA